MFKYRPLKFGDEIRLLKFQRSDGPGLSCQFQHALLSHILDSDRYEALSYAWGAPGKRHSLAIDGEEVFIPENLYGALQSLHFDSSNNRYRTIWADALCINQEDNDEQGSQVRQMGEIYSKADRVLIWIGQAAESSSQLAYNWFRRLHSFLLRNATNYNPRTSMSVPLEMTTGSKSILKNWLEDIRRDLLPMFDQAWFSRLWVVQEFVLAQDAVLFWGESSFDFIELAGVVQAVDDLVGLLTFKNDDAASSKFLPNVTGKAFIRQVYRKSYLGPHDTNFSALDMMHATSRLKCARSRDRIYSILALTNTAGIQPNYSVKRNEVFLRLTEWSLEYFPDLRALSYAHGCNASETGLPSWSIAPDFTHTGYSFTHVEHFNADGIPHALHGGLHTKFYRTFDPRYLQVDVYFVDRIYDMVISPLARYPSKDEEMLWQENNWDYRKTLMECFEMATSLLQSEADEAERKFHHAMIFGLTNSKLRAQESEVQHSREFFNRAIGSYQKSQQRGAQIAEIPDDHHGRVPVDQSSAEVLSTWALHRRFAISTSREIVWVPKLAIPGDEICLIKGSKVPFVLRKTSSGRYHLVGECWMEKRMERNDLLWHRTPWEQIELE